MERYEQQLPAHALPNWGLTVPVLDSQGGPGSPRPAAVTGYLESLSHDNRLMRIDLSTGVTSQVAATSTFQLRTDGPAATP